MKILQKISSFFSAKQYNDVLRLGGEYTSFQLRTMNKTDYLEAYKGWVFRAVSTIASKTASLDFHLADLWSGKQLDHEYLALIKYDLLENIASFMKLNGSCFVWKNTIGGKVRSLHVLRPDLVSFEYDSTWSRISKYNYQINGRTVSFKPEEILAFHNFNPLQSFPFINQGVGDVQAASVAIDTDNAASVWNWKFFENNARPGMILETEKVVDQDVKERLANKWNSAYKGVNNSHKLVILDGGLKANNLNPSQKEMDFVEQRRFSRDEILGIFGVPKAVIGLGDQVNVGNVKAFNTIFSEQTIKPLAIKIQEVLNDGLFAGLWYFEFVGVIPYDDEETRKDFDSGFVTVNEIRATRGFPPIKGGDSLKSDSNPQNIANVPSKPPTKSLNERNISEIIRKSTKGTEEFNHDRWMKRNARIVKHQTKMRDVLTEIFDNQEKDILSQTKKHIKADIPQLDRTKYPPVYLWLLKETYLELFDEEWNLAMQEVWAGTAFQVWDPEVKRIIREEIVQLWKGIDATTNDRIKEIYSQAIDEWLGTQKIIALIHDVFTELKEQRIETIVRTETIRASNQASVSWWTQSWLVKAKEWWTAQDERVSPFDRSLHGKIIALEADFFKKGDTFEVDNQRLQIDYTDIPAPPLHPNCRCTLLPITE